MHRKIQLLRDIVTLVFCAVLGPNVYMQMSQEPVFVVLTAIVAVFALLTIIDVILIALKVRNKVYFYLNSIIQLPAWFIIMGLLPVVGAPFFVLDVVVIFMLRREKIEKIKTVKKNPGKKSK